MAAAANSPAKLAPMITARRGGFVIETIVAFAEGFRIQIRHPPIASTRPDEVIRLHVTRLYGAALDQP